MTGYLSIHTPGETPAVTPISSYSMVQTAITHPDPAALIAVTGTGDADLQVVDGGFTTILNEYEETINKGTAFTTLADGRVQVNETGTVKITAYADMSHSVNNSTIGAVFAIERSATEIYSARTVHAKMPNSGDLGNLSGVGAFDAVAGDIVGIAIASNLSGNISVRSASTLMEFVGSY